MEKTFNLNGAVCLLAALLILSLSTCKKDAAGNINITGKWSQNPFGHKAIVERYEFKSDGSVEFYAYKIDTVTKTVIGYESKFTGKYKIEKSVLTMDNITSFANPTYSFGPVTALAVISGPATETYTITLNNQKNQLSFYFNCPANANCIPSPQIYYKQ